MKVTMRLVEKRDEGVFYRVYVDGDFYVCDTMTHSYEDNEPKTPLGEYRMIRGMHTLANGITFETFEVRPVPGHTGILFHTGNHEADSAGCFLTGFIVVAEQWSVVKSRIAFDQLMSVTAGEDDIALEIV